MEVLGIKLTHSKPRRPEGRGKIERFFRTVRDQFLVELAHSQINSIEGLNQSFQAWVEQVYHKRIHSETNESPLRRYLSGEFKPKIPDLDKVREAFLFTEKRTVTKTATVSLFSNCYEVDQVLIGRTVELVFDPFDLSNIDVIYLNKNFGKAVVHKVKRHSHPMVVKHVPEPVVPSGIDYLDMLEKQHAKELKESINYSKFNGNDGTEGGVEQ